MKLVFDLVLLVKWDYWKFARTVLLSKMIVAPAMDRIISFSCTGMSAISANANYTAQIRGDSAKSTIKENLLPSIGLCH